MAEYDVVRALLMILVVLGHCTYYQIATNYGGVYYQDYMQEAGIEDTVIHHMTSIITNMIYTFHMPLFMALSGAVFAQQIAHGKYSKFMAFVKNKAKRLLVPFIFTTLLVSVPLKFFSGYWDLSANLLGDIVLGQILLQGNSHLWFLATLFCEMMIFWLLNHYANLDDKAMYIIAGLSILHILSKFPIALLTYVAKFGIWFYLGMIFNKYRQNFNAMVDARIIFYSCAAFMVIFVVEHIASGMNGLPGHGLHRVSAYLAAIIGMWLFYSICYWLWKNTVIDTKYLNFLSFNSLGIYLYSDPFNYVILSWANHSYSINCFGNEYFALALYIARFFITFAAGIAVTYAVRAMLRTFNKIFLKENR